MKGHVARVNVSRGGVPKSPVQRDYIGELGLSLDKQAHPAIHGGPDRAVCLFSLQRIEELRAEGHPISPGSTGENLTVSGLDWSQLVPGVRLRIGQAVELEITSYASPCKSIRDSFVDGQIVRMLEKSNPGFSRVYARVLSAGWVETGDAVEALL